jgi:hypothetical protein
MPLCTSQAHLQTYWSVLEGTVFAYGQFCPPAKGMAELVCFVLWLRRSVEGVGQTTACGGGLGGGSQEQPLPGRGPTPTCAWRGRVLACRVRRWEQPLPRWLAGTTVTAAGAAPSPMLPSGRGCRARETRHYAWPVPCLRPPVSLLPCLQPSASLLPCLQPPRPRAPPAGPPCPAGRNPLVVMVHGGVHPPLLEEDGDM